jgi:superfamily II DNA or RNA helicase
MYFYSNYKSTYIQHLITMHLQEDIDTKSGLQSIDFPESLHYTSDSKYKPASLIMDLFLTSDSIQLKLGYFSSSALLALACCFAQFIKNGGQLKIACNHHLTSQDIDLLTNPHNHNLKNENEALTKLISKSKVHFYQCLKYLLENKRLDIIPIDIYSEGLVHFKEGLAKDKEDNFVFFSGSMNFTYSGLFRNGESLDTSRSWGFSSEIAKIKEIEESYKLLFSKKHQSYKYLSTDELVESINIVELKSESELLENQLQLILELNKITEEFKPKLSKIYFNICQDLELPCFPFIDGPREYQTQAYNNWLDNDRSGILAMATGTGKTITALNCILKDYELSKSYHNIIIVPTRVLLKQWEEELLKFNFREKIISVPNKKNWYQDLRDYARFINMGKKINFSILITYSSFASEKFQSLLTLLPSDTCLIFDEAHNIGSNTVKKTLENIKQVKRIGLSATPNRKYDLDGTKEMEYFFNDKAPYCYSFSTKRAINEGFLTKYQYFPYIVRLNDTESEDYYEFSKRIFRFFDSKTGQLNMTEEAKKLLLLRKQVIHKAADKKNVLLEILKDEKLKKETNTLEYTFLYAPEGYYKNGISLEEESRIIHEFVHEIKLNFPEINVDSYTSNSSHKDKLLKDFEQGYIHILASMKCLDEGVDIPRTEVAIFCSSTGNPRQFIQRRGRVLRKHDDKHWARIYDMVVVPNKGLSDKKFLKMEQSLLKSELSRVFFFSELSENPSYTYKVFEKTINEYKLNFKLTES